MLTLGPLPVKQMATHVLQHIARRPPRHLVLLAPRQLSDVPHYSPRCAVIIGELSQEFLTLILLLVASIHVACVVVFLSLDLLFGFSHKEHNMKI